MGLDVEDVELAADAFGEARAAGDEVASWARLLMQTATFSVTAQWGPSCLRLT